MQLPGSIVRLGENGVNPSMKNGESPVFVNVPWFVAEPPGRITPRWKLDGSSRYETPPPGSTWIGSLVLRSNDSAWNGTFASSVPRASRGTDTLNSSKYGKVSAGTDGSVRSGISGCCSMYGNRFVNAPVAGLKIPAMSRSAGVVN